MTSCDPDTVTYLNLKLSSTRSPLFRRSLRTLHAQTSLLRREGSKNVRGTRQLVNYKSNFLYSRFLETREFSVRPMDSQGFIDVGGPRSSPVPVEIKTKKPEPNVSIRLRPTRFLIVPGALNSQAYLHPSTESRSAGTSTPKTRAARSSSAEARTARTRTQSAEATHAAHAAHAARTSSCRSSVTAESTP